MPIVRTYTVGSLEKFKSNIYQDLQNSHNLSPLSINVNHTSRSNATIDKDNNDKAYCTKKSKNPKTKTAHFVTESILWLGFGIWNFASEGIKK